VAGIERRPIARIEIAYWTERGIYLRIIPALADPRRDQRLFASIFILVIASLVVQGWTVGSAARLLGFARRG
jgi:NhaP-type Na+/H+ and K+/H+ antiporter